MSVHPSRAGLECLAGADLKASKRIRLSYNDVHKAIQNTALKVKEQFGMSPNLLSHRPPFHQCRPT